MLECLFLQVVANIPFNISTDVVKELLPMGDIFSAVVLLLQVGPVFFLYVLDRMHISQLDFNCTIFHL